ncbi:MAG: hypothetical protein WCD70_01085 [Alphaproteobacteria bacterium]
MKKCTLAALLVYMAMMTSACAQTQDKHAVGDMYTKALNMIEAQGMLNTLNIQKHVAISDIHIDHGQIFITIKPDTGSTIIVYDLISGKIVPGNNESKAKP